MNTHTIGITDESPWFPHCSCGWIGVNYPTAEVAYHVAREHEYYEGVKVRIRANRDNG